MGNKPGGVKKISIAKNLKSKNHYIWFNEVKFIKLPLDLKFRSLKFAQRYVRKMKGDACLILSRRATAISCEY